MSFVLRCPVQIEDNNQRKIEFGFRTIALKEDGNFGLQHCENENRLVSVGTNTRKEAMTQHKVCPLQVSHSYA